MKVILASASPRRKELLERLGWPVEVRPSAVQEELPADLSPPQAAMALAARKVARLLPTLSPVEIAIAADTIVVHKGEILGKPADLAQARAFLLRLSGDWHTVHTGVAVAHAQRCWLFYETTHVRFHPLDPALIDFYLQTSPPLDKAGAYGAQDLIGMTGIAEIVGDFYNVVGLPIQKLTQFWYRTLGELPNLSS